ncbi:MAG: hypothetical protein M1829_002930 [Trizodia sp. TS-e1964]|nr:MAG: hypothetical protein M1829_002930 [Trizodia sp. TS-e1964]
MASGIRFERWAPLLEDVEIAQQAIQDGAWAVCHVWLTSTLAAAKKIGLWQPWGNAQFYIEVFDRVQGHQPPLL